MYLRFKESKTLKGSVSMDGFVCYPGVIYSMGDKEAKRMLTDFPDNFDKISPSDFDKSEKEKADALKKELEIKKKETGVNKKNHGLNETAKPEDSGE